MSKNKDAYEKHVKLLESDRAAAVQSMQVTVIKQGAAIKQGALHKKEVQRLKKESAKELEQAAIKQGALHTKEVQRVKT
jgi:hypothetical protein